MNPAGALPRRQQAFMLPARLGAQDDLATQAVALAARVLALGAPFGKNAVGSERNTVLNPAVPGSGVMSLRTSALIACSDFALRIACFHSCGAGPSFEAINRVPRLTPAAPSMSAAAMPRPSKMPPEATTGSGDTASTTCGTSVMVLTSPQ